MSMPETMFPEETASFYDDLWRQQPMASPQAGFFAGMPTGAATGVATGVGKVAELGASQVAQSYGNVTRAMQSALALTGADFPAAQEVGKQDPAVLQQTIARNADAYYKATRADPQTVGFAGQVLHSVGDIATRAVAAGPEAGAALVAGSEFEPARREFEAQGIDPDTAKELAAAQSVTSGLATILPGAVGTKAAVRMASGATINLSVGAASRYNTHQILADAGYEQQAAQYRVLDGQSIAADLLLGTFFGWKHEPSKPFATPTVPSDVVDAGLIHLQARQAEVDMAPGIPTTPEARQAHIDSLNAAEKALVSGDEIPPPEMLPEGTGPEAVPNPAQDAAREAAARAQAQAAGQASDGLVGAAKTLSEPPKTTEQWVREQIAKEQAANEEAQAQEPSSLSRAGRKAKAEAQPVDAETQQALDGIKTALRDNPELHDFEIEDPETGETMKASDALQQITEQARSDGDTSALHEIAAACGIRSA